MPPERRRMSMIFQSYAIWPNMTVWQNVAFGLELRKVPAAEMKQRIGAYARSGAPRPHMRIAIPPSSPAASSNASRWPVRSW